MWIFGAILINARRFIVVMKAVILDLDGVYFMNGKENFIKNMNKRYSVPTKNVEDVFLKSDMMRKYKQGLISGKEFWKYALNEWNIKATQEEVLEILQHGYDLNGKKKEIMRLLKERDIKKIICTNNFPERIQILDERFDFLKEFDHIVLSYEHKMLKPELLKVVSKVSGFDNSDITYFDDSSENIEYAKKIGMNAILIKEPSRVLKNLKEISDA